MPNVGRAFYCVHRGAVNVRVVLVNLEEVIFDVQEFRCGKIDDFLKLTDAGWMFNQFEVHESKCKENMAGFWCPGKQKCSSAYVCISN